MKEINVDGRVYVDKEELMELIKKHKKLSLEGKEKGFIEGDAGKRMSAFLALNHLGATLRTEPPKHAAIAVVSEEGLAYFSHWEKLSKDMPKPLRDMFAVCGVHGGDSMPKFTDDPSKAMEFDDFDFAREMAKRIERFTGNAYAVRYDSIQNEECRELLKDFHWFRERLSSLEVGN